MAIGTLDGGVLFGGTINQDYAYMSRVSAGGDEMWFRNYHDYTQFRSVILDRAGFPLVTGRTHTRGILIKFASDHSPPIFTDYTPEDLEFSVLPGDEVEFEVDAVELQEERIYYYWMVGEDTVSRRVSTDVRFDELGEYSVKCVVSDGELSDSVMWRVTAEEWYIDNYAPDSLAWAVRRPYEVDFILHVRAIEGVEPRYRWLMTDREHRQVDLGNDSGMTYNFDFSGDFRIEIRVSHDDIERSVNWQVAVKSVLWWWRPHEREFETYLNEPTGFSVIPLNADSDSLSYLWRVDGAARIDTTDGIVYTFDSLDEHRVTAIVHDGAEVDTVVWTVNVVEENAVDDDRTSLLPTEVTLYPASRNPFNSTVTIRYFLPRSADVSLTAYDSTGRLVQRLSEGLTTSGEHRATIQGAELPAGIYLLRLDTGSAVRSMKVVLLK